MKVKFQPASAHVGDECFVQLFPKRVLQHRQRRLGANKVTVKERRPKHQLALRLEEVEILRE